MSAKLKVLEHYGNKCVYCDTSEDLQIDHINGNGGIYRKQGKDKNIYKQLVKHGFSDEYQLVCKLHNRMKTNLSHVDFISEIEKLYNYNITK